LVQSLYFCAEFPHNSGLKRYPDVPDDCLQVKFAVWVPWEVYSVSSNIPLSCNHSEFFRCLLIISPGSTPLSVNGRTVAMILLDSDEHRGLLPC
jgi:hypothetical protein